MIKLVVIYKTPNDPEEFDRHYDNVHIPLVEKMPGVKRTETGRVLGTLTGQPAEYHRISGIWFESVDEMKQAFGSPEGKAVSRDVQEFAPGISTAYIVEA